MDNPTAALLAEIEEFMRSTGVPPSNFGVAALGDPNFVRHLQAGREPRFATASKVRAFMAAHQVSA